MCMARVDTYVCQGNILAGITTTLPLQFSIGRIGNETNRRSYHCGRTLCRSVYVGFLVSHVFTTVSLIITYFLAQPADLILVHLAD
jgi:hypothetical protein